MASAGWRERAGRLAVLPAAAVACLLAGCQGGGPTTTAAPAGPPSGVVVAPTAAPIKVTVAPASVAPGAMLPPVPTPSLPALPPPPSVAPCPRYPRPKQIPLHVAPGSGSAQVSWVSDGDVSVRSYRVTALSQQLVGGTQPAAPTLTTPRGTGCGSRSVSFSGLSHRAGYVFWLEEGIPDPNGALRYWMVGQSTGVHVP
jgi:hypothetical protein